MDPLSKIIRSVDSPLSVLLLIVHDLINMVRTCLLATSFPPGVKKLADLRSLLLRQKIAALNGARLIKGSLAY